jgi:(2Fe-2S) ferredoxin
VKGLEIYMVNPKYHIFVCTSCRTNGKQQGFCYSKDSVGIVNRFMEEIDERGLTGDVMITNTGCFGICAQGPVVVVYPEGTWYGGVTPDDVEEIVDTHIEGGEIVKRLQI